MQVRIVSPGEVLPVLLEDVELRGPDDMPRIWLEPGSNPPNLPKVAPKVANLRHAYLHDMHDVDCIWSHPIQTPADIQAGLEWYDVYSDLHGWHCPDDPTRPGGLHGHSGYFQDDERFGTRTLRKGVMGRSFAGTAGKIYAESNNVLDGVKYSKTANYVIEDYIFFGGSFIVGNFGAGNRDAVNIIFRRCVFIESAVRIGYNGQGANCIFEDNLVFDARVEMPRINGLVIRGNRMIIRNPASGGGYFWGANSTTNVTASDNIVYHVNAHTDTDWNKANIKLYEPGMSLNEYISRGWYPAAFDVVRPLSEFPAFVRRIDIPERDAAWMVVYNPSGAESIPLDGYYRVRDVRRWHSSYISNELVMSDEPDAPVNWDTTYGAPPIAPNLFPTFGIFRLETVSPEEIIVTIEQRLAAVETELASIRTAYLAEVAAKDAQIVTLTTERDAALASASVFRGVLGNINTLVAGYPPVP